MRSMPCIPIPVIPRVFSDEFRLSDHDIASRFQIQEFLDLPEDHTSAPPRRVEFSDTVRCKSFSTTAPVSKKRLPSSSKIPSSILRPDSARDGTTFEDPDTDSPKDPPTLCASNRSLLDAVSVAARQQDSEARVFPTPTDSSSQIPFGRPRLGAPSPIIASDTSGRSLQRNLSRLQDELASSEELLGESIDLSPPQRSGSIPVDIQEPYLPNDPAQIFHRKIPRPPRSATNFEHTVAQIVSICNSSVATPKASPFVHQLTLSAAQTNSELIEEFGCDLQALFDAHPDSTLSPGSEFCPIHVIEPLLHRHPFWPILSSMLFRGASYKFKNLPPDSDRELENEAILEYGNHSSAVKRPEALRKVSEKDTKFGFSLPITFDCARKIKNGRVGPLGVAQHAGINEDGDIVMKDRLAHDQSFSLGFSPSLNDLVDDSELPDLVFGWCLNRLFHQIVALRNAFPTDRILICKFDWGSAYRRINGDGTLTASTITTDCSGEFANILTRLSFGGRPHPAMFSVFSEVACDLCNDITDLEEWHPRICHSPLQEMMGPICRLDDSIPFHPGQPLAVDVETKPKGFHDVYLDDMVQVFIDNDANTQRTPSIVPLVLHMIVRPLADDEPIHRTAILAEDKMKAEGAPSETMRVLGWLLDTRRLLLILPRDKFLGWTKQIQAILHPQRRYCTFDEIESLLGKMTHACKGIPNALFYTKRMQAFKTKIIKRYVAKHPPATTDSESTNQGKPPPRPRPWFRYTLPQSIRTDLEMWIKLLDRAHEGESMNLLTCRVPTNVVIADSCPYGMGGFSLRTGKAWHVALDPEIYAMAHEAEDLVEDEATGEADPKLSNNLFEFICQVVTIWQECLDDALPTDACVLGLSDSSSATGWMHRSSFGANKPNHQRVSARLTELTLQHRFAIHSEHIPGRQNVVTDMLSRTFDCCDKDLTSRIHSLFPNQIPRNFRVCELPNEIKSWISSVAPRLQEYSLDESNRPTKLKTGHGDDGLNTSDSLTSKTTPFWIASRPFERDHRSSEPTSSDCETELGAAQLQGLFERQLSKRPLATWHRGSGISTGQAPATSRTATASTPS